MCNMNKINRMISKYNYTPGNSSRIKYIVIHRVAQFIFGRSVRNWAQNDTEKQSGLLRAAKYWCTVVEDTQDCPENLHICLNLCVV